MQAMDFESTPPGYAELPSIDSRNKQPAAGDWRKGIWVQLTTSHKQFGYFDAEIWG
jgi:hypothetical protein